LLRAIVHRNCGCSIYCVGGGEEALPTFFNCLSAMPARWALRSLSRLWPEKEIRFRLKPVLRTCLLASTRKCWKNCAACGRLARSKASPYSSPASRVRARAPWRRRSWRILLERGDRRVTLLDGDLVRKHLSSELTFSARAPRPLNISRIGFVAGEVTRHGGAAVCAPIAPYAAVRRQVRGSIERVGGFVEVYMATPLAVCEARDRKGLYAKARAGLLKRFTGVDDPYEAPEHAEIVLDTTAPRPTKRRG